MVKLLIIFACALVAAIPATFVYYGILNAMKPLLDKLRHTNQTEFTVKTQRI
jgi:hypothetical protein